MLSDMQTDLLFAARAAHQRRDWSASYQAFELASRHAALRTDDLDAFAFAAWRLGHVKESSRAAEQVFTDLARTDPAAAAMKANELALAWLVRGDVNIGQGWMNRAHRLLAGTEESAAHGYLAYLDAAVAAITHDLEGLSAQVRALRELSARLDAPAVGALSLIAAGIEALLQARTAEGYALIDEAILPLVADQVPIEWAGDIYCMVLHHCHKLADLPRMRSWTQSMEQWCGLSGSVPYGGVCDVHRLQVQVAGDDYRGLGDRLGRASRALEDINTWAARRGVLPTRRGAATDRRPRRCRSRFRSSASARDGSPARRGAAGPPARGPAGRVDVDPCCARRPGPAGQGAAAARRRGDRAEP